MKPEEGILICRSLYRSLSEHGFFVALTGGLLYKDGDRKDCDIVIYRHRQNVELFELRDIHDLLVSAGLVDIRHFGFVTKARMFGYDIDLFNPESKNGTNEDTYGS
ncbi:hypothetical protein [Erwinia phage Gungnir39]|nr:hypothetical protein [Erwinia phage Gungnir39]